MEKDAVRWVRSARVNMANRTDGLGVLLLANSWVLMMSKGAQRKLKTPPIAQFLDKAIEEADLLMPPAPWKHADGVWSVGSWTVKPCDGGWCVVRTMNDREERASRQVFPSADRARRWAELRFDRTNRGLRGPKPRAGSRSGAKLPDVRVTEAERDAASATLNRLRASYSEFVRAALAWADSHADEWELVLIDDAPRFVKRTSPST